MAADGGAGSAPFPTGLAALPSQHASVPSRLHTRSPRTEPQTLARQQSARATRQTDPSASFLARRCGRCLISSKLLIMTCCFPAASLPHTPRQSGERSWRKCHCVKHLLRFLKKQEAKRTFRGQPQRGVSPNCVCYRAVISCSPLGTSSDALQVRHQYAWTSDVSAVPSPPQRQANE